MPIVQKTDSGFTLIELSIVIIIIGLIMGGVVIGRDLIRAAEIRSQISQIDKFKAALYAFRNKYGGLPGDILATKAAMFGMKSRSGITGHGNGNYVLENCDGDEDTTLYMAGCETTLFWKDLSFANLIDGSLTTATDTQVPIIPDEELPLYFPRAKINGNSFVIAFFATSGVGSTFVKNKNKFIVSGLSLSTGEYHLSPTITPLAAYSIDSKIDDSLPYSGIVEAGSSNDYIQFNYGTTCREFDPLPSRYQLSMDDAHAPNCQLYFQMD